MIVNLYSVRDLNSGFNQPWCDKNDECATRGFAYSVNNNDIMGFRPSDFQLFQVGTFDMDTGDVKGCLPTLIVRGEEVIADR